ncbi:lipopolysaccharide-induced tumor necrosis factor-alpha factor homolog isoform X2 [Mixophyes fleayi]|uniref:lipopolysaccharide-induced tumor necrosis factor-alpha factor homolog isoform X2 n=1 Tax=Mixophyes fleayi TaxID=3061075 RepID=UPI003F4D8946
MIDLKIPNTSNMDEKSIHPPAYQPTAPQILSTPQYCMQPVPTITQPQAISEIGTTCQPKAICQQPVPVCTIEIGTQRTAVCIGGILVDSPGATTCPFCHENIVTRVNFRSGLLTWLLCAAIMFLGFVIGCCFIPFCMNATKDVDHYCPRCHGHIYKYKRL